MRFSLIPAVDESSASAELRESIRKRWSTLIMLSVTLLLVSGLYNAAMKAIGFELSMVYNVLLLLKIVLGLAIFYLAAVLAGRSQNAQKFRQRETYWLNILCALMIAVVMIAGYMKMSSSDFVKKVKSGATSVLINEK
jgi:putative copper export protein